MQHSQHSRINRYLARLAALSQSADAGHEFLGVDRRRLSTALPVLEVQVHRSRRAAVTHRADHLSSDDFVSTINEDFVHVAVVVLRSTRTLQNDLQGAVGLPLGPIDTSIFDRKNGGPAISREVNPSMLPAATAHPPTIADPEALRRADLLSHGCRRRPSAIEVFGSSEGSAAFARVICGSLRCHRKC